ncbi:metallophosphoesterase [Sporolactobacillus kofuensis]|uniref:Metallophosphoesterase n=1 Tax=Sporolactobacillus kofuensis TaxID=269672 RepID=A0ABW1WFP8_9BACL|nr:metallophosphoesterase [Sporolactobacillus kofuensis]MCO7175792.1 metallophosphoesterase [Sporolactobacillus kofuensis]
MIHIKKITLPETGRVLVISDIHGDLQLFQALLKKVHYTLDDTLIINGDLCEKGANSLGVIRYAKKLMDENNHVYLTEGNCDRLIHHVFDHDPDVFGHLAQHPHSIMNEWLQENGKTIADFDSVQQLSTFYTEHCGSELDWLFSLPTALDSDRYLFIHAGLDDREDWQETSHRSAVSLPHFYTGTHQAEKVVIVGHWPVVNYRANTLSSHNPIIDLTKRIISIDGGNQVRFDGQLNALIIERRPQGDQISSTYVDHFQRVETIRHSYTAPDGFVGTLNYPNYKVRLLEKGKYFSLCENIALGLKQWLKNEYLTQKEDGSYVAGDLSASGLSVSAQDQVAIIDNKCAGYTLIKKNGAVGWVPKYCF